MKVLLTYIDFNKTFDIHIDASKFQLCVFISQNDKLILVYSRKLNPAKTRYTTTKKKSLHYCRNFKYFKTYTHWLKCVSLYQSKKYYL